MAAPGARKRLALDSNILIDLAAQEDYAHTLPEEFQQRGYSLWLPPTVAHELLYASETKSDPDAAPARSALGQMLDWQIFPIRLSSSDVGIAEVFSRKLICSGLLPPEEFNDGLIVGETSLAAIPCFWPSMRF
ncbi:MAG: type II toxin-antitoxin system VapC family toxin [Verrucomicrobiota bacterium]|jgi:predicted nucleic acid-binding protein